MSQKVSSDNLAKILPQRGPWHTVTEKEEPANAKKTFWRLVKYIGKNQKILIALLFIAIIGTLFGMANPAIIGKIADTLLLPQGKKGIDFILLLHLLELFVGVILGSAIMKYLQDILSAMLSKETIRTLRKDLFTATEKLPLSYIDAHSHGDLMSRMTNDVENISTTVSQTLATLISSVITIFGTFAIMLYYSPLLTIITLATMFFTVFIAQTISSRMRKYFRLQQIVLGELDGHVEETVTGYNTVLAFNRQKQSSEEFRKLSAALKTAGIKARTLGGMMGPLMGFSGNMTYVVVAVAGGILALKGSISIGTIQAFLLYVRQFSQPVTQLANLYAQVQTALAGAERVFEILDSPSENKGETHQFPNGVAKGEFTLNNVYFAYNPNEPVLKNLNLKIKQGEKIAIVGKTGSGKTTIVNLLMRFYDVNAGEILLDGYDLREYPLPSLRKSIAIVLQETVLFSDTVMANIRYGNLAATDEEVVQAAKVANAHRFIQQLPKGYNTVLSESGENLSSGQRQLLAISRAVLANPPILILDEATASVDTRTEMNIQQAMIALMKGRTSIIIAHRLSTIRDADKIVVLDEGKLVEMGHHNELLKNHGAYYNLYNQQFTTGKVV